MVPMVLNHGQIQDETFRFPAPLAVLPLTAVGSGGNTGLPQLAFPMLPSWTRLVGT